MQIDKFKETAMNMWRQKYKANFNHGITYTENKIFLNGFESPMVEFTNDALIIRNDENGFESVAIPYMDDELEFIKTIQKEAKKIECYTLKNLKALRENVKLRDLDYFKQYQSIFLNVQACQKILTENQIMKLLNIKHIPVEELRNKIGQNIHVILNISNSVLSHTREITINNVHKSGNAVEDLNGHRWWIGNCFATNQEAEVWWLYNKFYNNPDPRIFKGWDNADKMTKLEKVNFINNIQEYLKFKKVHSKLIQFIEDKMINEHPEYFL